MKTSSFDYNLPRELIAQDPAVPRDACRLMVLGKKKHTIDHAIFNELGDYLRKGDVLVFNDSKVIPARIIFRHNGKEAEIFLTKKLTDAKWLAIGKPGKILQPGCVFDLDHKLQVSIHKILPDGQRLIEFSGDMKRFDEILRRIGKTPLPPYIKNSSSKFADYQTVFAREKGSVAAPTAGLHFTRRLLGSLRKKGVQLVFVTLHVGLGTFLPLKAQNIEEHVMHSENFSIDSRSAKLLNKAKRNGRRIIAVGTTSVRVLESSFGKNGFKPGFGETAIYIYPGYRWKCVDGIITNFHLPKSTLILLICSFGGREFMLKAYREAVKKGYRFYSFGDAMFIE